MKKPLILVILLTFLCLNACTIPWRILRYNYVSIKDEKPFPVDTIAPSLRAESVFSNATNAQLPPLTDWVSPTYNPKNITNIDSFLTATNTHSFMVVKNDHLLYENYFNGQQKNDLHIVFSITKSIVTTLVAIAIEEGHIKSVHQKVADFLPAFKDERKDIELYHLLQMNSGLAYNDYSYLYKTIKVYYHNNLEKMVNKSKVKHAPNKRFAYKSIDTQILSFCLEKATGKSVADYLAEKIWHPLGMEYPAYFTLDSKKNRNERTFGGMAIHGKDLLKFGKLFLNNGQWKGQQLVPENWITQINKREIKAGKWWHYTNGWWLDTYLNKNPLDNSDFCAAGYNGQILYISPENNTIIFRQGTDKGGVKWGSVLGSLADALNEKTVVDYTPFFAGTYQNSAKKKCLVQQKTVNQNDATAPIWTVKKPSQKRATDLILHCPRSLSNEDKMVKLIFKVEQENIVGLYFDNGYEVEYWEKTKE